MYDEAGTAPAYAAYLDKHPAAVTQIDRITERGLARSPHVLVDLCAGTGAVTHRAFAAWPTIRKIYVVDTSRPMLEQAHKLITDPRAEMVLGSGDDLDAIIDDPVDAIVCSAGIWQLDLARAFAAAYDVLTPGGTFTFDFSQSFLTGFPLPGTASSEGETPDDRLLDAFTKVSLDLFGFIPNTVGSSRRPHTHAEVVGLAAQAGFHVDEVFVDRQTVTARAMRDWLHIPAFTPAYDELTATETERLIDGAFAELPDAYEDNLVWVTYQLAKNVSHHEGG